MLEYHGAYTTCTYIYLHTHKCIASYHVRTSWEPIAAFDCCLFLMLFLNRSESDPLLSGSNQCLMLSGGLDLEEGLGVSILLWVLLGPVGEGGGTMGGGASLIALLHSVNQFPPPLGGRMRCWHDNKDGTVAVGDGGGGCGLCRGGVLRGAVGVGPHQIHGAELADGGLTDSEGLDGGGEGVTLPLLRHLAYWFSMVVRGSIPTGP